MKVKKVEKPKDYFAIAKEMHIVNQQRLSLEKREKELKKELTEFLSKQPLDAKKNFYLPFSSADGKTTYVKWEARQSISLDLQKVKDFFAESDLLDSVVKKVEQEVLDNDFIETLVADSKLSMDELESLTNRSISWALKFVNKKEETEDAN